MSLVRFSTEVFQYQRERLPLIVKSEFSLRSLSISFSPQLFLTFYLRSSPLHTARPPAISKEWQTPTWKLQYLIYQTLLDETYPISGESISRSAFAEAAAPSPSIIQLTKRLRELLENPIYTSLSLFVCTVSSQLL